jgi:threonine/homoserine/homoserine lactone efflux protein
MKTLLLFLLVYIMVFFTAIPIGATQIEIAKRSLNNQLHAGLMVVLGSVSSDVMYGFIALFGVALFLKDQIVIGIFKMVGAVILSISAFFTFRQKAKANIMNFPDSVLKDKRLSFITGFSLALTNPVMIFWWLIGTQVVKDLKLVNTFTPAISVSFLVFGGLGLASYLTTLALVLHWVKQFVSNKVVEWTYFVLGVVLVILSAYFLISSIISFCNPFNGKAQAVLSYSLEKGVR